MTIRLRIIIIRLVNRHSKKKLNLNWKKFLSEIVALYNKMLEEKKKYLIILSLHYNFIKMNTYLYLNSIVGSCICELYDNVCTINNNQL